MAGAFIGRRELLRRAKDVALPARRRPPGAVAERAFLTACDGCMACVEACPHRAVHTLAEHVVPGAGTPVMVPEDRACHMCEGFPCVVACDRGALQMPTASAWRLGVVRIEPTRCLPMRGPECGACRGMCPPDVDGLRIEHGVPRIDEQQCVGCGRCIDACVVQPSAIEMVPL